MNRDILYAKIIVLLIGIASLTYALLTIVGAVIYQVFFPSEESFILWERMIIYLLPFTLVGVCLLWIGIRHPKSNT
jgi:hypothetical protein